MVIERKFSDICFSIQLTEEEKRQAYQEMQIEIQIKRTEKVLSKLLNDLTKDLPYPNILLPCPKKELIADCLKWAVPRITEYLDRTDEEWIRRWTAESLLNALKHLYLLFLINGGQTNSLDFSELNRYLMEYPAIYDDRITQESFEKDTDCLVQKIDGYIRCRHPVQGLQFLIHLTYPQLCYIYKNAGYNLKKHPDMVSSFLANLPSIAAESGTKTSLKIGVKNE